MIEGHDRRVYRGRFAPSPTGALHFGSLVAAVGSYVRARQQSGRWLVRIEDIDPPREVPGSARSILDALAAFGLEPDEPVLWQHARVEAYAVALERLRAGGRAFPCWCSRTALGPTGVHRACVSAPDPSRPPAWRFRVEPGTIGFDDVIHGPVRDEPARTSGDFVLRRADGLWAYQLAVVVDDAFQGITEVVRGADLLDSTARQILLQRALGLETPGYLHLPLVVDADGAKLSKSLGSLPVDARDPLPALRAALVALGADPAAVASGPVHVLLSRAIAGIDLARLAGRRSIAAPSLPG
jgi:glutamyl-Q tRNA(Asp) synthetase